MEMRLRLKVVNLPTPRLPGCGPRGGLVLLAPAVLALLAAAGAAQDSGRPYRTGALVRLPHAAASFGAAVLGGHAYLFGGHLGRTHEHHSGVLSGNLVRLPLDGGGEPEILARSQPLQGTALVALPGGLLRIGGMTAKNRREDPEDLHSVPGVEFYDPAEAAWTAWPPLPAGRSSHDAAASGTLVAVAGGWTLAGREAEPAFARTLLLLDASDPQAGWREIEQPFERRAVAVAILDGRVWIAGGMDSAGRASRRVDVYDIETGAWSQGPDLPGGGFGAAACVCGGDLVVGLADGGLYRLPAGGAAWRPAGWLLFRRYFHRILPAGEGRLLAAGGASRDGHLGTAEILSLRDPGEGPSAVSVRVPWQARTRNRQAVVLDGAALHLFGGNTGAGQHDFEPHHFSSEAVVLDLLRLEARRTPDLPAARQSMAGVAPPFAGGGRVLLLGGFGHGGDGTRSSPEILLRSLDGGETAPLPCGLPLPLTQFGFAVRDGEVWIFGGLDYDSRRGSGKAFRHSDAVLRGGFDETREALRFETLPVRLPSPRRAFGGAQLGASYFIAGGMTEGFEPVADFLEFRFADETWTEHPAPAPRINPDLAALRGRLYLACGSTRAGEGASFEPDPRIECFDPERGRWTRLACDLPVPAGHARMIPFQRSLLFLSAQEDGALRLSFVQP